MSPATLEVIIEWSPPSSLILAWDMHMMGNAMPHCRCVRQLFQGENEVLVMVGQLDLENTR